MPSTRAAIAVMAIVSSSAVHRANGEDRPEIRVVVYDSGAQDNKSRQRALAAAGKLFEDAGVGVRWLVCAAGPGEVSSVPECILFTETTIALRIVAAGGPRLVRASALGFTVPADEGAVYTTVFADRVRTAARAAHCSEDVVLGYAVAHEIAHALLGRAEHTESGIMAARWTATELHQADVGVLRFPRELQVQLRRGIEERIKKSGTATLSGSGVRQ